MIIHGLKIKKLIKDSGDKLKEVSEAINVPSSTIASWYNLEYPPLDGVKKICDYYKITLWQFFLDDYDELKEYIQDFIETEDAALLKLINTRMSIEERIQIKKAFLEVAKLVLLSNEEKFKDLPEYKALFKS